MDDKFYKFFSNAAMYTADGGYFTDHSEIGYELRHGWINTCNVEWSPWHNDGFGYTCGYRPISFRVPVIFVDGDVIDPDALLANLDIVAGNFIGALERWSDVLDIELDDNVVVDDDLAVCLSPSSLDQCDSMKILNKVLNRILSRGQDQDQDELGPVVGSPSGQLRTRIVALGKYHLSVHVPILGGLGLTTWNSGFPSGGAVAQANGMPGYLLGKKLDASDAPWETRIIRTIYHPVYNKPHLSSGPLNVATASYNDNPVRYCHFLEDNEALPNVLCFGYNSNSFSIGLINHVGGILSPFIPTTFGGKPLPDLTVESHPGINKPVPSHNF